MYETSLLIFSNLFTGNDFTQNIKWVDSKLNLKYDFLKCSWNSYCFKYKLGTVPEGMNVFHYLSAANLNVRFYLRSLYSLYFPMKGWRSLLSCPAAWSHTLPGNVQKRRGERRSLWTGTLPFQCQAKPGYAGCAGSQKKSNNCTRWGISFCFPSQPVTLVPRILTALLNMHVSKLKVKLHPYSLWSTFTLQDFPSVKAVSCILVKFQI